MTRRRIRNFVLAALGVISWLGVAFGAAADEIVVYFPTTLTWSYPFPFVPSAVSGRMSVGDGSHNLHSVSFDGADPTAGPIVLGDYPVVIEPGTTLYWALGGEVTFGNSVLPMCAYDGFAVPTTACNPLGPPDILLYTFTSQHFGELNFGGALFATVDGAQVQVGTWSIYMNEQFIPEPESLLLAGAALAALALSRRERNLASLTAPG